VFAEERSRHTIVAGTILAAHAAVVYALLVIDPGLSSKLTDVPVVVRFVAEPAASPRQWQPPEVKALTLNVDARMPDAPVIESAVTAPSERAITVPVQATAVSDEAADRNRPKLISAVEYLRAPSPRYPAQSRKLREQGLVVLRVVIDEKGEACSIEVETSSGYTRLDHAAREAVQGAAFRPYVEDGAPRRALVLIPIEFSLNRGSA
jgi:periplasmic protein TonB